MATILDSLMVELGLDSSKFMANQKKVIDALKEIQAENEKASKSATDSAQKTADANKKSADQDKKNSSEKKKSSEAEKKTGEESAKRAKQTHLDTKKTADGYDKAKSAVLGLATAYFGLAGMKALANMTDTVAKETSARGRQATLLGVSEKDLQSWGAVGKTVGATEEDITSSLQNIQSAMTAFATGGASKEAQVALGFLNIDRTKIDDFAYVAEKANAKIADLKKAGMKDTDAIQWVRQYTMDIGYNDATFQMLMLGPAKLQELHDEFVKLGHITPQLKSASDAYNESTATLTQSLTGLYNVLSVGNLPFFTSIADGLSKAIEFSNVFVEKIRPIKSLLFSIGGNAIKSHIENVNKGLGTNIPTEWLDNKPIPVSPVLNNDISGPMVNADVYKRNNPGNLNFQSDKSAIASGAIGRDKSGFGIYPDTESGKKALDNLLLSYSHGKRHQDTISSIIGGVGGNHEHAYTATVGDQPNYIKFLAQKMGIGANEHLSDAQLHSMAGYIPQFEGSMIGSGANTPMNNGSSSQKTQNNNIVINSGSTDSRTLANEIPKAINTMTFISDGTQAVQ